jgi:C1A family cysteine protease
MKFFVSFLIAFALASKLVDEINSDPTSTWMAVDYPPEIMSVEKMRLRIMRDWKPLPEGISGNLVTAAVGADASFDSRDKWGSLILPVRDQGQCGSCWAFATAETVGDRVGIAGGASAVYSTQDLVSCNKKCGAVCFYFFFYFFQVRRML